MSKHTPGPWVIPSKTVSPPSIIAPGLCDICEMSGASSNESVIADARLIAAAPDLLEALQTAVAYLEPRLKDQRGSKGYAMLPTLRAAIAKATGEQQ